MLSQISFSNSNNLNVVYILVRTKFCHATKEEIFYDTSGEILAQITQRGGGSSVPRNIRGQDGQDSEPHSLVEDVPVHCRGALKFPSNQNYSMTL